LLISTALVAFCSSTLYRVKQQLRQPAVNNLTGTNDLHNFQISSLSPLVSCSSKIQNGLNFDVLILACPSYLVKLVSLQYSSIC